jgi:hypothetical protein
MRKLGLAVVLMFGCISSYAESMQALKKNEVVKTLENKTITTIPLTTLHGDLIDNTATVFFSKDGKLLGRFETKPENNPQSDEGTWKVNANGQTCVSWKSWNDSKQICVYIYKLSNSLIFVNTANKFESMVLSGKIVSGNQVGS